MADLLVLHESITVANPGHVGAWLPGMVVEVFEDGRLGPGPEQHPRFFVVRIPGVPKADVDDLMDVVNDFVLTEPTMLKRRRWSLDWNTLSNPIKRTIEKDQEITVTESLFRSYVARFD